MRIDESTVRAPSRSRSGALALGALLLLTVLVSACTSSSASPAAVPMEPGSVLIDVRTPAEFASGHLEGARNLDVQSSSFAAQLGQLDPNGTYLVYCRSGNRSADAIERMRAAGFTDLTDLGSVQEATLATGVPVVR